MAKKGYNVLIIVIIVVVAFFFLKTNSFLGSFTGTETLTQSAPAYVKVGDPIVLTFTSSVKPWAVALESNIVGPCRFAEGSSYNNILGVDALFSRTVIASAPSVGNCSFSGFYQFTNLTARKALNSVNVVVFSSHASSGCYQGNLYWFDSVGRLEDLKQSCLNSCVAGACALHPSDLNGDGSISFSELLTYGGRWALGTIGRQDVVNAITAWSSQT